MDIMPTWGLCRAVTSPITFAQLTSVRRVRLVGIIQTLRAACCRNRRVCRPWRRSAFLPSGVLQSPAQTWRPWPVRFWESSRDSDYADIKVAFPLPASRFRP
jgi:hypothetical protein